MSSLRRGTPAFGQSMLAQKTSTTSGVFDSEKGSQMSSTIGRGTPNASASGFFDSEKGSKVSSSSDDDTKSMMTRERTLGDAGGDDDKSMD